MKRSHLLAILVLAGCARDDDELGHQTSSILSPPGTQNEETPAAKSLVYTQTPKICSGTLITKNRVLTAAHCLVDFGEDNKPFGMGDVFLDLAALSTGELGAFVDSRGTVGIGPRNFVSPGTTGGYLARPGVAGGWVRSPYATRLGGLSERVGFDVAVLKLDRVLDTSALGVQAVPAGLNSTACPNPNAGIVGGWATPYIPYGSSYVYPGKVDLGAIGANATLIPMGGASVYTLFTGSTPLHVVVPGDSGGPLWSPGRAHVCGVNSAMGGGMDFLAPTSLNANADFVSAVMFDKSGDPEGGPYSPAHLATDADGNGLADNDGDGVPDDVDNCIDIYNPDQLNRDGDRYGDLCDNCWHVSNSGQNNSNKSAEEKRLAPPAKPPRGTPPSWGPEYLTANWPGDACDDIGVMTVVTTDSRSKYDLYASGGRTGSCTVRWSDPGYNCDPTTLPCGLGEGSSFFAEGVRSRPVGGIVAGGTRLTGVTVVRHCKCPASMGDCSNPTNPYIQRCLTTDLENGTDPGGATRWAPTSLVDPLTSASYNTVAGNPAAVHTEHWDASTLGSAWMQQWAWDYTKDRPEILATPIPAVGTSANPWDGVIWTWVKNTANYPDLANPAVTLTNGEVRQYVERVSFRELGSPTTRLDIACIPNDIRPWPPFKLRDPWHPKGWLPVDSIGCTGGCGPADSSWFVAFSYPTEGGPGKVYRLHGSRPQIADTTTFDPVLVEALRPASSVIVPMSDSGTSGIGRVIGVVVNSSTHQVTGKVHFSGDVVTLSSSAIGSGNGPLLAAMSHSRQEVVFFGEHDGSNQVTQSMRIVDLGQAASTTKPLLGPIRIEDPVAATFAESRNAYLLLDRAVDGRNRNVMRLIAIGAAGDMQRLGEWPRGNDAGASFGLTVSSEGVVVISTWKTTGYRVARLFDSPPGLSLMRVDTGGGALAVAATAGPDGAYVYRTYNGKPDKAARLPDAATYETATNSSMGTVFVW